MGLFQTNSSIVAWVILFANVFFASSVGQASEDCIIASRSRQQVRLLCARVRMSGVEVTSFRWELVWRRAKVRMQWRLGLAGEARERRDRWVVGGGAGMGGMEGWRLCKWEALKPLKGLSSETSPGLWARLSWLGGQLKLGENTCKSHTTVPKVLSKPLFH